MIRLILLVLMVVGVSACGDYQEELAGGYYYASEGPLEQVIVPKGWKRGQLYVPCNVEMYETDGRFIVARQRATVHCFWEGTPPAIQVPGKVYFWLIDTKESDVHGPLDARAFTEVRTDLGVQIGSSLMDKM